MEFSYDGADYSGLYGGNSSPSIVSAIEKALLPLKEIISVIGFAGRTDAGVHASAQVLVFDLLRPLSLSQLLSVLERSTPSSISIAQLVPVSSVFHPRGSARYRQYAYWVSDSLLPIPFRRFVSSHHRVLSLDAMKAACSQLIGLHDFSGFSCRGSHVKTPLKWVMSCDITSLKLRNFWSDISVPVYQFRMVATSFLYRMVRSIMSGILSVGDGSLSLSAFVDQLNQVNRSSRLGVSPACGLVFEKVYY